MAESAYLGTVGGESSASGAGQRSPDEVRVLHSDGSTTKLSHGCSVSVERRMDRLTFGLHGEFDLSCAETFQRALAGAIDDRVTEVIVDLHRLSFIDSAGLRALLYLRAWAERDGFDFVVLCGEGNVMRVLKVTGLDALLPVVNPSAAPPETLKAPH